MRTSLLRRAGVVGSAIACAAAAVLSAGQVAAAPSAKVTHSAPVDISTREAALGIQQVPKGSPTARQSGAEANPFLSLLADPSTVDWATWRSTMAAAGEQREASRTAPPSPIELTEAEAGPAGTNNTADTAEMIPGLGTGTGDNPAALLNGILAAPTAAPVVQPNAAEDNGSIPRAGDLGLAEAVTTEIGGMIGDGPHGQGGGGDVGDGSGDFDFYRIDGRAGQFVTLDTDTTGGLDSVLVLWAPDGRAIPGNDDFGGSTDSLAMYELPTDGPFYVSVGGFPDTVPYDPFDSSTGFGGGSTGGYTLTASFGSDVDNFAVDLDAGDVIGASVMGGGGQLELHDPDGGLAIRSSFNLTGAYPDSSPLPRGGDAVLAFVADSGGRHTLRILGMQADYQVTIEIYRAGGEQTQVTQRIYLDFDGACLDTSIFGSLAGEQTLSPMASFLPQWGLTPADESAVISAVVAAVKENIAADPRSANPAAVVKILNSRDNRDAMGQPGVSRVIVGGTVDELGMWTVGIAQSIDPGNFAPEESAVVLLDALSAPSDSDAASFNGYLTSQSDRVAFIGRAIGNVTSHEAGHLLGNFHTDQSDPEANLMDQGGNAPLMYGVGVDGIGGTPDDVDVDFGVDVYSPSEGLAGTQDTMAVTAFGLTRG